MGEFRDEGVSGTKELDDREGLSDLLARIRSNGVRVVLVERADRLARDLIVGELILNQLRELGVKVIAADSGTELTAGDDDPTRTLIRQVLGAVAQFEKAVIVSKLKAARVRKRRATGRCEGRKPFGTRPGEVDVVTRIHKLRRKPRGWRTVEFRGDCRPAERRRASDPHRQAVGAGNRARHHSAKPARTGQA